MNFPDTGIRLRIELTVWQPLSAGWTTGSDFFEWFGAVDLENVGDPLGGIGKIFDGKPAAQVVGHAQVHLEVAEGDFRFCGEPLELAEHAETDGSNEILQRLGPLAMLLFELLVVAVNRVVVALFELDQLFVG